MEIAKYLRAIGIFVVILATLSCQSNVESQEIPFRPFAEKSHISEPTKTPVPIPRNRVKSITDIDFKNFTFPWTKDQAAPELFTLKDGKKERVSDEDIEATLRNIEYGDVTNDEQKEAMVSIYPYSGGNCQCYMVYIYTLKNGQPLLLWHFDTWDKAVGGFKRAYSERGKLVVELFGDNKFENDEWEFDTPEGKFNGYCCPTAFTRIRFDWQNGKFVAVGKREVFDYDWKKQAKENQ